MMTDLPPDYSARIHTWQTQLAETGKTTATLFSNPTDVTYFTGFEFLLPAEREAFVLISPTAAELWYASFSPLPTQLPIGLTAQPMRGLQNLWQTLKKKLETGELVTLQFDAQNLTVAEHAELQTTSGAKLIQLDRAKIWTLRQVKDLAEQALLRKSNQLTDAVVTQVITQLTVGQTEKNVATLIEQAFKAAGAEGLAFPTIVAFGDHTALPHHQPTDRALTAETAVLIDAGAKVHGYCADLTRSFWFGQTTPQAYLTIAEQVKLAYRSTTEWITQQIQTATPITAKEIDAQARQSITKAGFGEKFIHTTGHGTGLDIHEPPSLNWNNEAVITPGVCFTVEPGIYLPGEFGYRYENSLLLTPTGIEVLSQA
jgi:Xaa-Pro aminopeptidase